MISLLSLGMMACGEESKKEENAPTENSEQKELGIEKESGIIPPFENVDVPVLTFEMNSEEGGQFVSNYGSIVTFPPNAVLHADGTLVTGAIEVKYREFQDPLDIFFSGIPMSYDSAGTKYNFVSAGMCELKAFQIDEELIVNPSSKPEISMVSKDDSPDHNLYYYNDNTWSWGYEGKSENNDFMDLSEESVLNNEEPIKPKKINNQKHCFEIQIDESMQENSAFAGFDKLNFQIADEEKGYNPADSKIQWYNVEVEKAKKYKGKYVVTFSNGKISKSYLTDPVFTEEQYDAAMKIYNDKMEEYKTMEEIAKKAQEAYDQKMAYIKEQNRITDSINKEIAKIQDLINANLGEFGELQFPQNSFSISRGFQVSNFGVWNCDNPMFALGGYVHTAVMFDKSELNNKKFTVIYNKYNSTYDCFDGTFRNLPDTPEVLFIVDVNKLYYGSVNGNKETAVNVKLKEMDMTNMTFNEVKKVLLSN